MAEKNTEHQVHKITLPNGTEAAPALRPCDCPNCNTSGFVMPTASECTEDGDWWLALKCGQCEWEGDGVFSEDQVAELDERIDEDMDKMIDELQIISYDIMRDEVDRFTNALKHNAILPEDLAVSAVRHSERFERLYGPIPKYS